MVPAASRETGAGGQRSPFLCSVMLTVAHRWASHGLCFHHFLCGFVPFRPSSPGFITSPELGGLGGKGSLSVFLSDPQIGLSVFQRN